MAATKTIAYQLTTITNLHVGSESVNYGIVDQLVQRDPLTGFPTIHGSSLKGALKEYFKFYMKGAVLESNVQSSLPTVSEKDATTNNQELKVKEPKMVLIPQMNYIFGGENDSGKYKILPAWLLFYPVRSNHTPYFLATSPGHITDNLAMFENLGLTDLYVYKLLYLLKAISVPKDKEFIICTLKNHKDDYPENEIYVEDYSGLCVQEFDNVLFNDLPTTFHVNELVIFQDNNFIEICKDLPVIARNRLEDGISQNLWYEEVVPRQTVFITFIIMPDKDNYYDDFEKGIMNIKVEPMQIGGNGSVGYGFCNIKPC